MFLLSISVTILLIYTVGVDFWKLSQGAAFEKKNGFSMHLVTFIILCQQDFC